MVKKELTLSQEQNVKLQSDIFNYLKDNLRISVNNDTRSDYSDYGSCGKYISINTTVSLYLTDPETKEELKISSESSSESFHVD